MNPFKLLTVFITLAMAGCSVLPKPDVETRYALQPVLTNNIATQPITTITVDPSRTIRIARPEVPLAYRGSQLVLLNEGEQTYYAGKSWEAPIPDLLGSALSRDLANALPAWVVSADTSGVRSAYELQTDVRTFSTIQKGTTASVVMDIDIRLLSPSDRRVLQVLPYHFRQPLSKLTTEQTVAAYNKGWQQLVAQVAQMLSATK